MAFLIPLLCCVAISATHAAPGAAGGGAPHAEPTRRYDPAVSELMEIVNRTCRLCDKFGKHTYERMYASKERKQASNPRPLLLLSR